MLTFERRRHILKLLSDQPGLKVIQLAGLLDVSEGTIRNDLDALASEQKLRRVRGGAVLLEELPSLSNGLQSPPPIPQTVAKQQIVRWAAELVEDGDVIFVDASTTVQQMVPFLRERRNLTIVTNGLKIAQMLTYQNSQGATAHDVIVIGGLVNGQGEATGGNIGATLLERLHIQKAFISVAGFTLQSGLMERTVEQAQLKEKALEAAEETILLVDATKLGKVSLMPFAQLNQIAHFFTNEDVAPELMTALRRSNTSLTICGKHAKRSYTMRQPRNSTQESTITIGFANQSEAMPFAVEVRRGLERAAAKLDHVDLIVADNQLSGQEALRVADLLLDHPVDLVIEYQIDYGVGSQLMDKFQRAQVPVVAVDIPMIGATYFGVDNYRAGSLAGKALGEWIIREWNGEVDRLVVLEEPRAGALPAARIQGQIDALQESLGPIDDESIIRLDSGNTRTVTKMRVTRALQSMPATTRLAFLSFNADAAVGALAAAREMDREESVVIVGQGGDRSVRHEIRNPASRLIGSTANMPERYGEQLLPIVRKLLQGEPVPPAVYIDHVFLNINNIGQYYPD